ncbi:hypothetical protein MSP8887_00668 [Marinomonas spartinae]|uniref:hypothetical protein n=1 Tax=Marinomonas spartinae TaxID=1792290 RepID=UPI0008091713|nr:hypothetical protein [Marinomonas spartinae]SBS27521.1 hypothetical protein MSP8887_00668 [Marinomonas spartinae]
MMNNIVLIVVICLCVSFAILTIFGVLKWYEKQRELKKKATDQLVNRCYRILSILDIVMDRYMPHQTKLLLVDYLLTIIPKLGSHQRYGQELADKLSELFKIRDQLKSSAKLADKGRVTQSDQLSKIQASLSSLPALIKGFALNGIVDKQTAKQQVELIRYGNSLAYHDLLVHQADSDVDMDKKARALEKYRTALVEMEKVAAIGEAQKDIDRLKRIIESVEQALFTNRSTGGS